MPGNPVLNARGDNLLFGGSVDPRVTPVDAPRGSMYIFEGNSLAPDPQIFQKNDNGPSTNWSIYTTGMERDFSNALPSVVDIDLGANKIVNLANPTDAQDAATKDYVDSSAAAGMQTDFSNAVAAANAIDLGANLINNVADPVGAQDAATKNYVDTQTATAMQTDFSNAVAAANAIDLGANLINNVADPVGAQDAATKNYVDTQTATAMQTDFSNAVAAANAIDLGANLINNVADPVGAQDAATKNYVDTEVATRMATDFSNAVAAANDIDLSGFKLINVTDPTDGQDAATKNYVDNAAGAAMQPDFSNAVTSVTSLDLGGNLITEVADPVSAQDAATKAYVDAHTVFADDIFRIQDDGDPTKELAFQVSGITAATTRTITMPDADVNLGALTTDNVAPDGLNGSDIRLNNNQSLRGRNSGNTADVDLIKLNASNQVELGVAGTNILLSGTSMFISAGLTTIAPLGAGTTNLGSALANRFGIVSASFYEAHSPTTGGSFQVKSGASLFMSMGPVTADPIGGSGYGIFTGSQPVIPATLSIYTRDDNNNNTNDTGDLHLLTGNKTVGTADSGDINIKTGEATDLRGSINLNGNKVDASASIGAFRLPNLAADPGTPANGDMWYNTTSNELKAHVNGVTVVIA